MSSEISICGSDLTINAKIHFAGPGDNATNEAKYIANVQNVWTGTFGQYHVTTHVEIVADGSGPLVNTVELFNGAVPPIREAGGAEMANKGHSFTLRDNSYVSVADMEQKTFADGTTEAKGQNTTAHEFGHLVGLEDVLVGSGLMAAGSSAEITQSDIDHILNSPAFNSVNNSCPVSPGADAGTSELVNSDFFYDPSSTSDFYGYLGNSSGSGEWVFSVQGGEGGYYGEPGLPGDWSPYYGDLPPGYSPPPQNWISLTAHQDWFGLT